MLQQLEPTDEALSQLELEELFSKSQTLPLLREYFQPEKEQMEEAGIDKPAFYVDLLAHIFLHKSLPIDAAIGILWKHNQDKNDPFQATADMIEYGVEIGLADLREASGGTLLLYMIHDVSREIQQQLDMFQYPLPMIEPPMKVTNNKQTGYRTIRGSLLLRDNHHDDDICLDHINRSNSVAMSINSDVAQFINNSWRNLDRKKEGESHEDWMDRRKAFNKYDRTSRAVLEGMQVYSDKLWLTHRYDKRGRTYCAGFHVNPQGNDWNKAVIELANKKIIED